MNDKARFFVDNSSRVDGAPGVGALRRARQRGDGAREDRRARRCSRPASSSRSRSWSRPTTASRISTARCTSRSTSIRRRSTRSSRSSIPGPQTESVTKTFNPRSSNVALAQFGFIVIEVGNRGGNPQRSKWYHNYGYGNLRDYGLRRQEGRGRAARQAASVHRHQSRRHLGPLGRRLHDGRGDARSIRTSSRSASPSRATTTTTSTTAAGARSTTASRKSRRTARSRFEYDIEKNSGPRQEPEGQAAAHHRRHRQQRASGEHLSPGRRAHQGQQALRHHRAAGRAPLVPAGRGLRQLAARRLLRAAPARRIAETSISSSSIARGSRRATRSHAERGRGMRILRHSAARSSGLGRGDRAAPGRARARRRRSSIGATKRRISAPEVRNLQADRGDLARGFRTW